MSIRRSLAVGAAVATAFLPGLLSTAAAQAAVIPGVGSAPLVAYADRNFTGAKQSYGAGVFDAAKKELGVVGNDAITSLYVASGYRAVACDNGGSDGNVNKGSLGACRYFDAGLHAFVGDLNDKISLLAVMGKPVKGTAVTAYQETKFTGASLPLGSGGFGQVAGNLATLADSVKSLKVTDGYRVVACDNDAKPGTATVDLGKCRLFRGGEHTTVGGDMEKKISLVAVGAPPLIATSDADMTGLRQQFNPGVYTAFANELATVGNDKITSLRVADGWRVVGCRNDSTGLSGQGDLGLCRMFGAGEHGLAGNALNDGISTLVVQAGPASGNLLNVYADRDFKGATATFGPGLYTAADLAPVGNDAVSSLRVPGAGRAVLCDNDSGQNLGACRLFVKSDHLFVGADINDKTSLIALAP
ncbi:hypothetical protein [Catellatospora methionotrophica]|uniref:hypothetical protein n=1 Tax=Catellatospora methionotrophica TaxID=121620 RepID=UPI0014074712|nr:hypothetical protein [Catellatospora methionotrophica]